MGKHTRLRKLAKHLLATTCLTAGVAGMVGAQTVNESADFGSTFANASSLPAGTRTVNGGLDTIFGADSFDSADFVKFSGLLGGSTFSFTGTIPVPAAIDIDVFSSSQAAITSVGFSGLGAAGSNVVPLDGILVFDIRTANSEVRTADTYSLSLTATDAPSPAPEPATIAGMGLGLAVVAGFARRRRKKN
jgi:hypothetical protein